jgi:hypothetical protein
MNDADHEVGDISYFQTKKIMQQQKGHSYEYRG